MYLLLKRKTPDFVGAANSGVRADDALAVFWQLTI